MTTPKPNTMADSITDLLAQLAVEHYEPFQRKDVPRTTKGLRR